MAVLWALCWIGRLGEAGAPGLSWLEDADAGDVSQLLQIGSLSDAWTYAQISPLMETMNMSTK